MREEPGSKAVSLPAELYGRVEARVKATGFGSVDEYVIFVLEEVLKEGEKPDENALSKEDEAAVKKRLKALGYLE